MYSRQNVIDNQHAAMDLRRSGMWNGRSGMGNGPLPTGRPSWASAGYQSYPQAPVPYGQYPPPGIAYPAQAPYPAQQPLYYAPPQYQNLPQAPYPYYSPYQAYPGQQWQHQYGIGPPPYRNNVADDYMRFLQQEEGGRMRQEATLSEFEKIERGLRSAPGVNDLITGRTGAERTMNIAKQQILNRDWVERHRRRIIAREEEERTRGRGRGGRGPGGNEDEEDEEGHPRRASAEERRLARNRR